MTCKDCIHIDLCEALEMNGLAKVHPKQCGFYTDKSRYVELQCKVGDTVYIIKNRDMLDTIMGVPLDEMAAMIEEKEKGERKQTELVRKIFTEINKIIDKHHSDCNEYEDGDECDTAITYIAYISCDIDDLYQKYMEGGAE